MEVLLRKGKRKGKHKGKLVINWVVPENMFNTFEPKYVPPELTGRVEQRVIRCRPETPK